MCYSAVTVTQALMSPSRSLKDVRRRTPNLTSLPRATVVCCGGITYITTQYCLFLKWPNTNWLFLVTPFQPESDLSTYVQRNGPLPIVEARTLFRQIARALSYLHSHGIVHREATPANVLVTAKGRVKLILADFTRAACAPPEGFTLRFMERRARFVSFMAPELLDSTGDSAVGFEEDVWSCACLLLFMLAGSEPFCDGSGDISMTLRNIRRGQYRSGMMEMIKRDRQLRELLGRMLEVDPKVRAAFWEVLENPWVQRGYHH